MRAREPRRVVDALARASIGETFNFYRDGERADLLRTRLGAYLERCWGRPIVLVGEAAGWRGARVSGIPFTSERQLAGTGPAEATATIVHHVLEELDLTDEVLLWNAVPTHPHNAGRPDSNRAPTRAEVAAARPFLGALVAGRTVVAVGRTAALALPDARAVRHPSRGGARAFRAGLVEAFT